MFLNVLMLSLLSAVHAAKPHSLLYADDRVQNYLMAFGYLPQSDLETGNLRTDDQLRDAIRNLQSYGGIPVTGEIDEQTKKLMKSRRCGLSDRPDPRYRRSRHKRFTIHGQPWPYKNLTWSLRTEQPSGLDTYGVRQELSRALDLWARNSKLTFQEVNSDQADILIYFHRGYHGDGYPFDGRGQILAHAFFPGKDRGGDAHFDEEEIWLLDNDTNEEGTTFGNEAYHACPTSRAEFFQAIALGIATLNPPLTSPTSHPNAYPPESTSLFAVAAHEFGHSLGLAHSSVRGALMYPWYQGISQNYELPEDDRNGIQQMYGAPEDKLWGNLPGYRPPVRPTTTTTTTTTQRTRLPTRRPPKFRPTRPNTYPDDSDRDRPNHYPYKPNWRTERPAYHPAERPDYSDRPRKPHRHHTTTTTTVTPHRPKHRWTPPPRNDIPDKCDTSYDAISIIRREVFVFKGRYLWRIGDHGLYEGYPAEITRLFNLPEDIDHVDAVYERQDKKILFFIGKNYYVFNANKLEPGYPRPLRTLGLPDDLKKIDGAMVWGHNSRTYFFSGTMYWRFDESINYVELDYPRDMSMFSGVGDNIDAVFQWKDGKTYFFKGKGFWEFDDMRMRVAHERPRASAPFWMGCPPEMESNDIDYPAKRAKVIQSSSSRSSLALSIIISSLFVIIIRIT